MIITLGLIASALVIIMSLTIKRSNILALSVALGVVTTAQYAFLGQWGTVWLTAVACAYSIGLMFDARYPFLAGKGMAGALLVAYSLGFFGINGLSLSWSLIAYGASILGALMLLARDPLNLKWMMFINGIMWLVYQLASGAYGQIPGEIVYLAGVAFSLLYLSRAKKKGRDLSTTPEFTQMVKNRFSRNHVRPAMA